MKPIMAIVAAVLIGCVSFAQAQTAAPAPAPQKAAEKAPEKAPAKAPEKAAAKGPEKGPHKGDEKGKGAEKGQYKGEEKGKGAEKGQHKGEEKGKGAPAKAAAAAPAGEIDINTASEAELRTLPGVGEARAAAIIKGRPYKRKDELVQKKILTQGVYDGIKDRIIARQKA